MASFALSAVIGKTDIKDIHDTNAAGPPERIGQVFGSLSGFAIESQVIVPVAAAGPEFHPVTFRDSGRMIDRLVQASLAGVPKGRLRRAYFFCFAMI